MIEVRYDEKELRIDIVGHAGAGPVGHDLVCASVSILFYTLCENIEKRYRKHDDLKEFCCQLNSGDAYVKIEPREGKNRAYIRMLRYTMTGLNLLQMQYPENVKITEV